MPLIVICDGCGTVIPVGTRITRLETPDTEPGRTWQYLRLRFHSLPCMENWLDQQRKSVEEQEDN